ncbi:hypothetical protein FJ527_01025 [Mesorhizobium sp. B2-4-18]|uniref:cysteine peptidase family C39 domain-containing protein n=1 Tax=Mesorhizobium sp. B2-4-18 TaxID=2589931 RepID=UPI0011286EE3|nr:cysteine peptidase family C39 domain-containing protein [Mesorhizobium sp. B2-4-18]TPK80389.1 hypothetical protein FJ527_01025 [Mesorhizobium sp. B2-4-18]
MRLVKQSDENGCGVACVAMIADITYSQARKQMFGDRRGGYTNTGDLRRALAQLGIQTGPRLVRLKKNQTPAELPFDAILKTNVKQDGEWHWVIWDSGRQKVLDSRVPPYRKYRHRSYLEILPLDR